MAIDTAQKRRSMVSFGDLSFGERVPLATDFATAGGRAAQEYLYFGLTPDVPVTIVVDDSRRRIGMLVIRGGVGRRGRG